MSRPAGSISTVALWLVADPASTTSKNFSDRITALAERYSTPPFHPHVTLLTRVPLPPTGDPSTVLADVRHVLDEWADPNRPALVLKLGPLGSKAHDNNYFQYLFHTVGPSESLARLRTAVRRRFHAVQSADDDYFPHMSLMYGTDSQSDSRIASDIMSRLDELDSSEQRPSSSSSSSSPPGRLDSNNPEDTTTGHDGDKFIVSEVWCVRCQGPVESWQVLGKVKL